MKITKTSVDAIKPSSKDQFFWDDALKGFGIRVSPRGKKTFIIQYRFNGRTQRVRLGHHGGLTVFEAKRDARILLGEIAKGKSPAKSLKEKRDSPILSEVAERFLNEHAKVRLKPTTQSDYRHNLKAYILPSLGALQVNAITHQDVHELHQKMSNTPVQANRTISVLSKIFSMCERWGYRQSLSNPCTQIERYKETRRHRFLDHEELSRLWEVLDEMEVDQSISLYAVKAFKLLILTGCRLGEIRTLQWSFIKGNRVEFPNTKTGYKRVPFNKDAMFILGQVPKVEGNAYVICGSVEGQPIINLQKSWRRVRVRSGLADVRIHDLRHTFASHAVMGGTPLALVGKLLGHSQIATTMRYAHLADTELAEATDSIGSLLNKTDRVKQQRQQKYLKVVK